MSTHIENARRIQQNYRDTVEAIRRDTTLSEQGRRQRLTEAYRTAASKMDAVKNAHSAEAARERESLQKSVFGLSFKLSASEEEKMAAQMAYRDALDRVSNLKTEQAVLDLLESAHLTGDRTLLRAVSLQAYRGGWGKALARYSEIAPDHARRISALREQDAASTDPMVRLGEGMAFSLSRPPEVDMNALHQAPPAEAAASE